MSTFCDLIAAINETEFQREIFNNLINHYRIVDLVRVNIFAITSILNYNNHIYR